MARCHQYLTAGTSQKMMFQPHPLSFSLLQSWRKYSSALPVALFCVQHSGNLPVLDMACNCFLWCRSGSVILCGSQWCALAQLIYFILCQMTAVIIPCPEKHVVCDMQEETQCDSFQKENHAKETPAVSLAFLWDTDWKIWGVSQYPDPLSWGQLEARNSTCEASL